MRTRVGYAGGSKENPTYRSLGDHSETVQIDYDPKVISYRDLLKIFWQSHNPTRRPWSRQYMAAIFYHDEEQQQLALETRAQVEAKLKRKVFTQVLPFTGFYLAEDYHQKFGLQQEPVLRQEFRAMYPRLQDFVDSTAAARVNGYINGLGSHEQLQQEVDGLGLSPPALDLLRRKLPKAAACPAPGKN